MKLVFTLKGGEQLSFSVYERSVTVGRSINNRVVVPFETFSRNHCLIEFIDEEIIVTDLGSANGVFINGERISVQVPTPYRLNEKLLISDAHLEIIDEATSPEVPIELLLGQGKASSGSNIFHVRERNRPAYTPNTTTKRLPNKNRPKPIAKVKTESFSFFDPVGIIVIVVMLSGFMFYRSKMNRVVKKAPPAYHHHRDLMTVEEL